MIAELRNRTPVQRYGLAIIVTGVAFGLTFVLAPMLERTIFVLIFAAIAIAAAYGGVGPGMLAAALGSLSVIWAIAPPPSGAGLPDLSGWIQLASFLLIALIFVMVSSGWRRALRSVHESQQWLATTVRSIGDAVIATDERGRVTFMNLIAQNLTGWTEEEAAGRKLTDVFKIVNEETRLPAENPVEKVMQNGTIVGLANRTVLIARDGRETPIEDSAAPIRGAEGKIAGVVMVFHNVSERRRMETDQRFLYEAGELLASSLDYERTLTRVARLACPEIADWCAVDVLEVDGRLKRLAVAHADPEKVKWAHELQRRYPPDPDAPRGLHAVLRTGRSELYPEVSEEMIRASARDEEHLSIMRSIGFTSAMIVPLVLHGRVLGAISFVAAESGRRYSERDLDMAESIARKASMAIENARLYRDARETSERLREQAARLTVLADTTKALNQVSLDERAVLETVSRRVADLIGDCCIIRLLSDDGQWLEPAAFYHPDPDSMQSLRQMLAVRRQRADEGVCGQVVQQGRMIAMPVADQEELPAVTPLDYASHLDIFQVHSFIVMPLRTRGRTIGTLGVARDRPGRPYNREDESLLSDLADRAALVIENARLYRRVDEDREWFEVTLSSIGDAVIATDTAGRITFLNDVARNITGWGDDAIGLDLDDVFNIINEQTRKVVESPVEKVLRKGQVVGLANHTVLVARDGREVPIDDSAAPIIDSAGVLRGVVMVFHDISERRTTERERMHLFEQVHEQRERLNNLITNVPGVVWEVWEHPEAAATMNFVSDYLEKMLGYTPGEWHATRDFWLTIVHPDDRERVAAEAAAAFAEGKGNVSQFRWIAKDGGVHWIDSRSMVILDDGGRPVGMRGVAMDITPQKIGEDALRESETRFRTVADTAPVLIWQADTIGRCTYFNRTWLEFTGRVMEEEIGNGWVDNVHPDDARECLDDFLRAFRLREPFRREFRLRHVSGGYRWVLGSGVPRHTPEGAFAGFIGSCIDIDDRRKMEDEMMEAKDAAEAASSAKDQFLAVLSHELRTPLTPVLAMAQVLETDAEIPEDMRPLIEIIRRNVELEVHLIDDMLDLVRVARGKLRLAHELVDMHALLGNVLEVCRDEIDGKRLHLTMVARAARHHVVGDPARMQQIFWNLVKNAVKFTHSGGSLAIRTFNPSAGRLAVEVCDTGIGIEADALPRIFNAFEQAEQTVTRQFGGLGLGLAITKGLVDGHGGSITVRSEGRGRGTCFTVEFGTADVQSGESAAPQANETASHEEWIRILLVDDHEDTRTILRMLLERHGYRVSVAASVKDALKLALEEEFDLLVSDIGLPDGSGLDLIRAITSRKSMKAVALSGFGMDGDIRRSREAGFAEHLTKPVTFQKLHEVIRRLIV